MHSKCVCRFRRAVLRAKHTLARFWRDDIAAELIQFALVAPILIGVLWSGFELWQIMTLRATVRTAVSQVARYVTAFGAPPGEIEDPISPGEICWNVEQLVAYSFNQHRGILGDAVSWDLTWYRMNDPTNPAWDQNAVPVADCYQLLSELFCNDQFGVELHVSVPWRTVLFGLGGSSSTDFVLEFSDITVGSAPCQPYCDVTAYGHTLSSGSGGCVAQIGWRFECSYEPDLVEVWVKDEKKCQRSNPAYDSTCNITLPVGVSQVKVIAFGGQRESSSSVTITCP
jgi:hypothetical protein